MYIVENRKYKKVNTIFVPLEITINFCKSFLYPIPRTCFFKQNDHTLHAIL